MTNTPPTFYEQEIQRIQKHLLPQYQYVKIRQSKTFMERYHAQKIDLQQIAASAFMSRFHYIRIFQRVYGLPPRQYLRDLRISKAKDLLKTGLSVTQVCFEVGYESLPTFSQAFKRGTGYSPKEFQTMNKSNPE